MFHVLTVTCAIGCSLVSGVFFIFSVCVMRALGTLPPPQGIRAMQAINVVILNPWFLGLFAGTAVLCIFSLVWLIEENAWPPRTWAVAGCLLYLIGLLMDTRMFNIPRNEALAAIDYESADGAKLWEDYLKTWTWWNHVRTTAALAAAVAFLMLS